MEEKRKLKRSPVEPANKTISWFIEPIGGHTNEVIARRLAELNEIADSANLTLNDSQGTEHSVYQLSSHKRVLEFCKSQKQFQLKFNIYTRVGLHGNLHLSLIDTDEFKQARRSRRVLKKAGLKQ